MRVLFLTHSYPRSDDDVAGAFLLRLAGALTRRGTVVEALAPAAAGLRRRDSVGGVPVERFRYAPAGWETLAYSGTMVEQVRNRWTGRLALVGLVAGGAWAVRRAIRDFQPDVVHCHWWFPLGVSAALAARVPLVLTLHGSDVRVAAGTGIGRTAFRMVASRAAMITTVSRWLADRVAGIDASRACTVAPMPVDEAFAPPASDGTRAGALFVGRLNAQKGIADALAALSLLPAAIHLDVVGDGPDRSALERRAAELGVGSRVRWHGPVAPARMPAFYQRAAVTVIPSREEGLGLVAVESLLCGTPAVAYRSGGLEDVVAHEQSGILVEPGDIEALGAAVGRLVGDPERSARMGKHGRESLATRFAPDAVAATYEAIYRSVLP